MIPLSNGRSPRVDQFYATLRAIKSHHIDDNNLRPFDQNKSIQHIRSLGKEIFENPTTSRKRSHQKQLIMGLNKSTESLFKRPSLYEKYKQKANNKVVKQIAHAKQIIKKQQLLKSPEKLKKNKKYEYVGSKIQVRNTIKGLNYAKKADLQAQKLKKQKTQNEKIMKQFKQKQQFYQRNNRVSNLNTSRQVFTTGLIKRGQQLQQRKQKCIQKIRTQQIEKEMSSITFHPRMTSRRISTVEDDFQKRIELSSIQKLYRQKDIIKQTALSHRFTPQTNEYKDADSKVARLWKQPKMKMENDSYIESSTVSRQGEQKSQKTTNSTSHINLKNMNELSFIFE